MKKIPIKQIVMGLSGQDEHVCDKPLFPLINRVLNIYGYHADVHHIGLDSVKFCIVKTPPAPSLAGRTK